MFCLDLPGDQELKKFVVVYISLEQILRRSEYCWSYFGNCFHWKAWRTINCHSCGTKEMSFHFEMQLSSGWGSIKNMGRSRCFRCQSQGFFIFRSSAFFRANDIGGPGFPVIHMGLRELWRRRLFKVRSWGWETREGGSPWICRKGGMWHRRPCVVLVTCFLDFTLNLEH